MSIVTEQQHSGGWALVTPSLAATCGPPGERGGFLFDSFPSGHDARRDTTRPLTASLALHCSSDLDSVVQSVHQPSSLVFYLADRRLFPFTMLEMPRDSHRVNLGAL